MNVSNSDEPPTCSVTVQLLKLRPIVIRIDRDSVVAHFGLQLSSVDRRNNLGGFLQRHVAADALAIDGVPELGKRAAIFDRMTG